MCCEMKFQQATAQRRNYNILYWKAVFFIFKYNEYYFMTIDRMLLLTFSPLPYWHISQ